jgi:hypothetical protein
MMNFSSKTDQSRSALKLMKLFVSIVLIFMVLVLNVHANEWSGNVNFFLGQKLLDNDDWGELDQQDTFGVLVDFKPNHWPVSIALDFLGSYDEVTQLDTKLEASAFEFDVGVRKIWEFSGSSVRPYIGGGYAFIWTKLETSGPLSESDDDFGTGIWLNGGVYWTLGQSFNLGLDLRYTEAEDISLYGVDSKAGGGFAGLMLGYHW